MSSTSSCPRCGHSFNGLQEADKFGDQTAVNASNLWALQAGDVAVIQEEVRRMDSLIHQLNRDRARLLQRVNNLQATTRRLPPEVLSTIFQFAHPPIDFDTRPTPSELLEHRGLRREAWQEDDFQLVLGAVSWHWRQVVWATPQMWTTLSVEVHEATCGNMVSLLELYFKNSRRLPMTVELDFRAQLMLLDAATPEALEGEDDSLSLIETLQTPLLNNAAKIRNLIVTGLPPEWFTFIGKTFSHCQSMMLYWPPAGTKTWRPAHFRLDLVELSSLHHLRLKELYTPAVLPWSILTILQLVGMPINVCVESLAKCPNLIEFEATSTTSSTSRDYLHQPVVLEYLESFTWVNPKDDDNAWNCAFLRHIRFSKLRILKWSDHGWERDFSEEIENGFVAFFSHLPVTLRVLELTDVWYDRRILEAIFTSVPCLLELVLIANDGLGETEDLIVNMIGRPAAGSLGGTKITTCLRKLVISGECAHPTPHLLVEMLEALRSTSVMQRNFCLELTSTWRWRHSYPSILAEFKRLAESGLRLKILVDSVPLDYMLPSC